MVIFIGPELFVGGFFGHPAGGAAGIGCDYFFQPTAVNGVYRAIAFPIADWKRGKNERTKKFFSFPNFPNSSRSHASVSLGTRGRLQGETIV